MTSKINIDIAKIKEERKQFASMLEQYKTAKAKQKRVNSLINFDGLKKFQALEKFVSEPSIPVEEYGDPTDNVILEPDQFQSICNAQCAYKRTIHRKGQANIKISNVLKYNDYSKEEKQEFGMNLLYLMSVHPEYTQDCFQILDQWSFEWQPTFLEVCIVLENFGCNIRKYLSNHHIPDCYEVALIGAKVDFEEYRSKSTNKYVEISEICFKNFLIYLKSIIGYYKQEEVQSLLVILSALSIDTHCIQHKETFNELVNKCFVSLENVNTENLLNSLYLLFEKSTNQCYYVNQILYPCNSICEPFTIQLAYLFMCNLLFNYNLVEMDTSVKNVSISNRSQNESSRSTRSKRKLDDKPLFPITESHSSPKKKHVVRLVEKENTKATKTENTNTSKPPSKSREKGKRKIELDKSQKSILDYWKVRAKSPDLSSNLTRSPKIEATKTNEGKLGSKDPCEIDNGISKTDEEHEKQSCSSKRTEKPKVAISCVELNEDSQDETEDVLPTNTPCDQLRNLIFSKYKNELVSFPKLYKIIRRNLQYHLDCPVRIYRIVNLLNAIVKLLAIEESNMVTCKLLMQELSQVQLKYYGLHDMHRHLVCVYLQQYTTLWGASVNKIQYLINQREEDEYYADSEEEGEG